MMKYACIVAAVVAAVAVSIVLADSRVIQLQRCSTADCSSGCQTIMEYKPNQCHSDRRSIDHGEMLECSSTSATRQCFYETVFDNRGGQGCKGPVVEAAPRECGVCTQDVFPLGTFMKFSGCGTPNMTVQRDCDYGCNNCNVMFPINQDQCTIHKFHSKFRDFAFLVGAGFSCGANGDIKADHFFSPVCDGEPNFRDKVLTGLCYTMFGHGHKFLCS